MIRNGRGKKNKKNEDSPSALGLTRDHDEVREQNEWVTRTKNVFLQKTRKTRILIIAMAGGLCTPIKWPYVSLSLNGSFEQGAGGNA